MECSGLENIVDENESALQNKERRPMDRWQYLKVLAPSLVVGAVTAMATYAYDPGGALFLGAMSGGLTAGGLDYALYSRKIPKDEREEKPIIIA